jgi:hypothetical protein
MAAPEAAPVGARMAMVMRDTQVSWPFSLRMSICHTCVVRPRWMGLAMPSTQPFTRTADVVGVDVQADGAVAGGRGERRAARAQRFGQHHRHPAVQDAGRLLGASIDRAAGADEVVADFEELDAEHGNGGVDVDGREQLDGGGLFPDGGHV